MSKISKEFIGNALYSNNIGKYIKQKYNVNKFGLLEYKRISTGQGYLQEDYGEEYDCTITSMSEFVKFFDAGNDDFAAIYFNVEKIAKIYGYKGNKTGTNPLFINSILKKVFKNLYSNSDASYYCKNLKSKYIKSIPFVGWDMKVIKKNIDNNKPLILNIFKDGRKYYDNHSITIIGYATYLVNNKEVDFLIVHDNWSKFDRYVDYSLLNISSINYIN